MMVRVHLGRENSIAPITSSSFSGCLRTHPSLLVSLIKEYSIQEPPENLEKIFFFHIWKIQEQSQSARTWVSGDRKGFCSSLIFLDPVPAFFALFPILFCLNNFFVPSTEESHLRKRRNDKYELN